MPRRAAVLLAAALALLAPRAAPAGPWTRDLGRLYVKVGQALYVADGFTDGEGRFRPGDYLGATTSLYAEVGIAPGLQLNLDLGYLVGVNREPDGATFVRGGGGDATFGLQYTPRFLALPFALAARAEVKVPLYDAGSLPGEPEPGLERRYPAPGDGQIDLTFWLSAGVGLAALPLYAYLEVGYRHRTEAFVGGGPAALTGRPQPSYGDGVALRAEVGYTFFRRLQARLTLSGVLSPVDGDRPAGDPDPTRSALALGPGLALALPHGLALEATYLGDLWARAASQGHYVSLGLSYSR